MTIAVIVQARMTSKRFPGKTAAPLLGRPVLEHVLVRAKMIPGVDKVVCAFPEDKMSAPILVLCRSTRVIAFAGDENDVLGRYYEAAKNVKASVIMRITGDCPLIDPMVCGALLRLFLQEDLDYASNIHPVRTFPKGLDCETFTCACLNNANACAVSAYDREHVTPWMQRASSVHKGTLKAKEDRSDVNYCVDYPEDIARLEKIMKENMCVPD